LRISILIKLFKTKNENNNKIQVIDCCPAIDNRQQFVFPGSYLGFPGKTGYGRVEIFYYQLRNDYCMSGAS
jgi:hypothetical protein